MGPREVQTSIMTGAMKSAHALWLILLLPSAGVFAQSVRPASQPSTAQIHGTIKDPTGANFPDVVVTFQSETRTETRNTDGAGEYRAELAPGLYTMDVSAPGFRRYHRPLFKVSLRANLTFDITMQLTSTCDFVVVNRSGEPATAKEQQAATEEMCMHEELLPVQSEKGTPFPLFVQYGKVTSHGDTHEYMEAPPVMDPVFVAYNLFSLEADHVTYDTQTQVLDARGHVAVASSGRPEIRTGEWMKFKIENGRLIEQGCTCSQFPKRSGRLVYHNP